MRLDGRRRSDNVDDRRKISGKTIGFGGGIVGIIILAVVTLLGGGDLGDVARNVLGTQMQSTQTTEYVETEQDRQLAEFASIILASTEDVWTQIFREKGWGEYQPPKMVLFHGQVHSGCGQASAQTGPFYCSADQTVYIDLDFFKDMQTAIGGGGDFAYAYVIAHEVGHHVQNLRGILPKAHEQMQSVSDTEANKISVRLELQADCYAGVWGNVENRIYSSLEPGDIEEAVDVASKIGDDYLQKKAQGYEIPDSFNHGRSEWRVRWLKKGLQSGDPDVADTFTPAWGKL